MKKKPICYTFGECIFGNDRFLKRFLSLLSLFIIGNIGVVVAQEVPKFTVDFKNASLTEVFDYFGKNSDYKFTYNSENVKNETKKITESFKNVTLEQILTKCLDGTRFSFEIVNKNVVITLRKLPDVKLTEITGRVVDENGNPVPGATVLIQGTTNGVVTNMDGYYETDRCFTGFFYRLQNVDSGAERENESEYTFESRGAKIGRSAGCGLR